jgi:hypothetical protein
VGSYERMPGFVAARLGEEMALLDLDKGEYLGFNATAAFVWQLLEKPRSLTELCSCLAAEFDVEEARCRTEVLALVRKMIEAGLAREYARSVA